MNARRFSRVGVAAIAAGLWCNAVAIAAEVQDFSRYEIIIKREPFGSVQGTTAPPPPVFQNLALVGQVLLENGERQAVIHDRTRNRSYYRAEGESFDEIVVVHIEDKPMKVVLKRGLDTGTLTYEERGQAAVVPGMAQPPSPQPPQPTGQPGQPRRIPFRRGG